MRADNSGAEQPLLPFGEVRRNPSSWTPDGSWLAFQEINQTGSDIWMLSGDGDAKPFLETPAWEWGPQFSPDGNLLAYSSDVSGRFEIYIQRFPGGTARVPVSATGGTLPVWSRDGRALFYVNGSQVMAIRVASDREIRASSPQILFEHRAPIDPGGGYPYDVSPDGQRFLTVEAVEADPPTTQLQVTVNWFEELTRLVPTN
jgi:Tol biopolymer transport system component